MKFRHFIIIGLIMSICCFVSGEQSQARVVNVEILKKDSPAFEGREFGPTGAYERIMAKVHYAVDPKAANLAGVVDLDKAPRNAKGEVEFSAEMVLLRPVDPSKRNGGLFYEVPNRGRNISFSLMNDGPYAPNPTTAKQAGNGFLMDQGYTIAWSGWQRGVKGIKIFLPTAQGTAGKSREEFIFDNDKPVVKKKLSYPAADLDVSKATLTVRVHEADKRRTVPGLSFKYLGPKEVEITRPKGLSAGAIYEFIYPAKDSVVSGLGFVAVRDVVSYLKGLPGHDQKPLVKVDYAIGLGISQSGRFVRDFLYQGFNADDGGNKVFDGVMVHIAGSRKTFTNYRFAQPGRYSRQHEDHSYPNDQFPFAYADSFDPLTGRSGGVLTACRASGTCPKVMHTDTSSEFWQARSSLLATDTTGRPLDMPEDVRLYYLAGTQHFAFAGANPKQKKPALFPDNPAHAGVVMRALLTAMDNWVTKGETPPASRFPNPRDHNLIAPEKAMPAKIPGLNFKGTINRLAVMDYSALPPKAGANYPIRVPATDCDGNDTSGIRLPHVVTPLATHLGWNLRKAGYSAGDLYTLTGSCVAFPKTKKEAKAAGDSRTPIDQRYENEEGYLAAVQAVIRSLVADRLVLKQDGAVMVERAKQAWQTATSAKAK